MGKKLADTARVVRSKNAGPYEITLDIIFGDKTLYSRLKKMNFFTKELVGGLYSVPPEKVRNIIYFDPACALKITLGRETVSAGIGDTDVYGAQQHAPLLELELPGK